MKNIWEHPLLRHRWPLAAGAGLLLALAFPDFNLAGFAWIAPALLLAAAHGQTGANALRLGYVAGLAFWLASLGWLLRIPVTGFPILGWLALAAYLALFFGVWLWLVSGFRFQVSGWSARTLWTLGGAAAWVALEMLRARLFGGFPWNLLGDSQFKLVPLIQLATVTGVYGVSFLAAWFSLALFSAARMIFQNPTRRLVWQAEIILPLTATMFCYLGGFFAMNRAAPAENFFRVTLVQPSIPQTLIWSASDDAKRFRELLELSQRALTSEGRVPRVPGSNQETNSGTRGTRPSDLLLWPESAVPALDDATYRAIVQFAQSNRVWILFNGDDVEFRPPATNFFNSALLLNPDGRLMNIYHKRQLVIFGEYVPLAHWLPFLQWFTPITGGWTPGDQPGHFEITSWGERPREPQIELDNGSHGIPPRPAVNISPLICFEDVFPGLVRDATDGDTDFLVNLTNDGWFGDSAAQWQHAAAAVFRAVENRRPLIRCANNGVTCWIDDNGRLQKVFTDPTGNVHGAGGLTIEIPLRSAGDKAGPTFYHRHGDWFGWSCVFLTALLAVRKYFAH